MLGGAGHFLEEDRVDEIERLASPIDFDRETSESSVDLREQSRQSSERQDERLAERER
jgi:hypothetical protein